MYQVAWNFSTGAPLNWCESIIPRHGFDQKQFSSEQSKPSDIVIDTSPLANISPYVRVSIVSTVPFKGFVIIAVNKNDNGNGENGNICLFC